MTEQNDYSFERRRGGCHCGAVRFEINVPTAPLELEECNCSICRMSGFLHLIIPASRFELIQGHDAISVYTFNTGVAQHSFCRHCGVKSFYTPRSNPDGIDINVHCLDEWPKVQTIKPFDGQNWEKNAHTLAHKTKGT